MLKTPAFLVIRDGTADWFAVTAAFAYRLASRQLPPHASPFSPQKFTQPQLLALLVLQPCLGGTYRSVVAAVQQRPALRRSLDLAHVPHHTTLKHFADRLPDPALITTLRRQANRLTIRFGQWTRRPIRRVA